MSTVLLAAGRSIDVTRSIRLFGREEATGITSLIAGVAMAYESDEQRTAQGASVVDGLWSECRRREDANATRVSPPSSLLPLANPGVCRTTGAP